jgi:acetoin utilization deacetylase AcuC-like enzyme
MAVVTEGGYHLQALGACLNATLAELARVGGKVGFTADGEAGRARTAIAAVRAAQKAYWPTI